MIKTEKFPLATWLVATWFILALLLQPAFSLAQEAPKLRENQKAVILADLRIDQFIAEAVAAGAQKEAYDKISAFAGVKLSQIERVFGAACLPEDFKKAAEMLAKPSEAGWPFEFFLQVKFTDKSVLDQVEASWKKNPPSMPLAQYSTKIQWGKPSVFPYARRVDETTFEIGTSGYLQQAKRDFFTEPLNTTIQSTPEEPLRLVLDMETRRDFTDEAVETLKQGTPQAAHAYLDLIDNLKSLSLTVGVGSENLFGLVAQANNDDDAEEFGSGIDSLLALGKIGVGNMYRQTVRSVSPDNRKPFLVLKEMADSLGTDRTGTTVKLEMKKPEDFKAKMASLQQAMRTETKSAARKNDFRQVALSIHNYESLNRRFPFKLSAEGQHETISWRVKMLPFLNKTRLFKAMDMKKGAGEDPNPQFAKHMPKLFGADGGLSSVSWIKSEVDGFAQITDGSSNTIMLIENPKGRPWLENNPLTLDEAVALVTGLGDGERLIVAFYDGSISTITNKVSAETLRLLFDPSDGKAPDLSWK